MNIATYEQKARKFWTRKIPAKNRSPAVNSGRILRKLFPYTTIKPDSSRMLIKENTAEA